MPKSPATWIVICLLTPPVALFLLIAVFTLAGDTSHLLNLASEETVFGTGYLLTLVSALLSLTAIVGAGFALFKRKLILALAFAVLTLPAPLIIEGSRCDTLEMCRATGWAALPASAFNWQVRFRPVTDPREAEGIASAALWSRKSDDSPFLAKRFSDHWIVSTMNGDGWPGAHAVRIDTRTARTSMISCPQDKIQCGMERPTVSDGRRVYRNTQVGITAIFPASRAVCTSRSDDGQPRGFVAMVRPSDIPCESLDRSRQIGVEVARSKKSGCKATEALSLAWSPLTPETARLFKDRTPTLGGLPSLACELHESGFVQISIYASAGSDAPPQGGPGPLIEAYIVTTPTHLAEDVRVFETFLAQATVAS